MQQKSLYTSVHSLVKLMAVKMMQNDFLVDSCTLYENKLYIKTINKRKYLP